MTMMMTKIRKNDLPVPEAHQAQVHHQREKA
jgi:hypothetical protein